MYQALREALPVQRLANEINCIVPLYTPTTNFCLTVQEDNLSSIAMLESLKFIPRTKYIAVKYYHFEAKSRQHIIHQATYRSNTFRGRSN